MNSNSYYRKKKKGFYAAVVFSLLAVAAAVTGIMFTMKNIRSAGKEETETSIDWDNNYATVETEANKFETGVEDERPTDENETTSEIEDATEETSEKVTEEATENAHTEEHIECSLPLKADILKDYSNGTMVKSKTMNDWRTHNGVDFTGETGDEIRAVCAGTVKKIEKDSSWGTVVTVEHDNGYTARYCGIGEVSVNEGDCVERDFVLGTLGVIPVESADAAHLHFEMLKDGKYSDPVEALSMQREED